MQFSVLSVSTSRKAIKNIADFKNTTLRYFYINGVPDVLMNIMSFHGFSRGQQSAVTLISRNKIYLINRKKGLLWCKIKVSGGIMCLYKSSRIPMNLTKKKLIFFFHEKDKSVKLWTH